ncbi:MAG: helix-turn-helix transcriptional regulator [Clostridia bacterium]|nr:helix-turn-helix transcriptional regulator [Clostridia bacterium]
MDYQKTLLETPIVIDGVYSVHYFEYAKDFAYSGEIHDFWEIVYADKQSMLITAGAKEILLPVGHLYLHKPNEFHNIRCDGVKAANSVIVSFDCDCPELMSIAGMVIAVSPEEKTLLGAIIKEAGVAFATPLGQAYTRQIQKSDRSPFGSEQLIRLYLEQLLIYLIRGNRRVLPVQKPENNTLLIRVCDYLEKHVEEALRFGDIKEHFSVSASVIKKTFRDHMDCGVMEYFTRLKVDAAKEMIRSGEMNFTEIADRLSFNTSQYFTTVFRRVSGMTPTEYARSVRSAFEGRE